MPAGDGDPERRDIRDLDGVVLAGDDGLGEVAADLLRVHVERGDECQVRDVVLAQPHVHQPGDLGRRVGIAVVLNPLDQRGSAVAHADNGDTYRAHDGLLLS